MTTGSSSKPTATPIDLETFARKESYLSFKEFEIPISNRTIPVAINNIHQFCKEQGLRFSLVMVHLLSKAANKIPEFRYRIDNDVLVEYEKVVPRAALLRKNKTVAFTTLTFSDHFPIDYSKNLQIAKEMAATTTDIQELPDHQGLIFISPALMHYYSSMSLPYSKKTASIPTFHFGKYAKQEGEMILPLSMQLNHALIDAYHVQLFLQLMESYLEHPQQTLFPG